MYDNFLWENYFVIILFSEGHVIMKVTVQLTMYGEEHLTNIFFFRLWSTYIKNCELAGSVFQKHFLQSFFFSTDVLLQVKLTCKWLLFEENVIRFDFLAVIVILSRISLNGFGPIFQISSFFCFKMLITGGAHLFLYFCPFSKFQMHSVQCSLNSWQTWHFYLGIWKICLSSLNVPWSYYLETVF